jgi:hypothetical protein
MGSGVITTGARVASSTEPDSTVMLTSVLSFVLRLLYPPYFTYRGSTAGLDAVEKVKKLLPKIEPLPALRRCTY